jgi:hypothetical protein
MSKKTMRFPEVPGDTPRERFTNRMRHVISLPKSAVETRQKPKRHKSAKGALALIVLLIMGAFVSMLFIAPQVLAQDAPRGKTWYDGGKEWGGMVFYNEDCPEITTGDSPAKTYENISQYGDAHINDKGNEVVVDGHDSTGGEYHAYYFRTKAACKARVAHLDKQKKDQENKLDQYR